MKNTFSVLATLATTVAATGFRDFSPFPCPGNIDNKCTPKQSRGFDFGDFPQGPLGVVDGFQFSGFTCKEAPVRRFAPRTFGGGKSIGGVCHPDKGSSPSFGCGAGSDVDRFSLGSIHVRPEFDCDLEFHYDMPDGSTCKHRSPCSRSGTTVTNSQCGGAKNVTIVYPSQPNKPKPSCSVDVHTISFSCGPPHTKPPRTTYSATTPATSSSPAETTTTPGTTTYAVETTPSGTTYAVETTTPSTSSYAVETSSAPGASTTTYAVETTPTTSAGQTTPTYSAPAGTSYRNSSTTYSQQQPPPPPPTYRTSSPPPQQYTTSSVAVSSSSEAVGTTTSYEVGTTTTSGVVSYSQTAPSGPSETLPCPDVVPQCLNTFLFSVSCVDNSDSACYCPNAVFIKNVFDCIYAHGQTAEIVSQAVLFVQGICAPYASSNPAIATGATVTSYVTVTTTIPGGGVVTTYPAASVSAPAYTTVTVEATTVVPCTDESGSPVPSSSTTVVVATTFTVPQVGFTTGGGGSSVGVVGVTSYPAAATPPPPTTPYPTTAAASVPVGGTGAGVAPSQSGGGFVTVNAGGRVGASLVAAGLAVVGVVAAAL